MSERRAGAGGTAEQAQRHGHRAAAEVQQSKPYQALVTVGLVCYGIVHVLIGWVALQLAWGGGGEASQQGAVKELASKPFGGVLLVVVTIGLTALVIWQLIEAVVGHTHVQTPKRYAKRIGSAGKAVVYAALALAAGRAAAGGGVSSSGQKEDTVSGQLMAMPFGQFLVGLLALGVIAVGGYTAYRGIRRKFTEDLDGSVSDKAQLLGVVGYLSKGFALVVVGVLFLWAAIRHDPNQAGGLDAALRTLLQAPFGQFLLTLVALGLIAFGIYCFFWSRNARHEKA